MKTLVNLTIVATLAVTAGAVTNEATAGNTIYKSQPSLKVHSNSNATARSSIELPAHHLRDHQKQAEAKQEVRELCPSGESPSHPRGPQPELEIAELISS